MLVKGGPGCVDAKWDSNTYISIFKNQNQKSYNQEIYMEYFANIITQKNDLHQNMLKNSLITHFSIRVNGLLSYSRYLSVTFSKNHSRMMPHS